MEEWIILENEAVFKVHGDYTIEDLEEIVENNNRRIRDTGDLVPITLGHTREGADEEDQPLIVGLAEDFYVGTLGKETPQPAIFCRMKFYKDLFEKHDIGRQYTRRSCELWIKDKYLDPIAVLGATTPFLDLGLLGKHSKKYRYSMTTYQQGAFMDQTEDLLKDLMSKLEQHEVFAYVRQLMKEHVKDVEVNEVQAEGEKPVAADAKPEDKDTNDKDRLQKDVLVGEVEKFKHENTALRAEFEVLQRKFRRAERERDLVRMETVEGISFDMGEELDLVQDMTDDTYTKHKERMRKRYQRAPVGVNLNIAQPADHGGERQFSDAEMWKAIELSQGGMSYEEAVKTIKGGTVVR